MAPPKIPISKSTASQPSSQTTLKPKNPSPPQSPQVQPQQGFEDILEAMMKKQNETLTETITGRIKADLDIKFKSFKEEISSLMIEMAGQTEELGERVEELREEISEVKVGTEYKIGLMEEKITDETTMRQYKEMEYALRVRGLKEDPQEDLLKVFTEAVAPCVDLQPDELEKDIEKIYRINSAIAKQRNLPRDIVVFFARKSVRNGIIQMHYQKNIEIANQQIMILKEIPPKMLKVRKDYAFLTQELRNRQIQYRWEIPQGIMVFYQNNRHKINTVDKAKIFLKSLLEGAPPSALSLEGEEQQGAAIESLMQDLTVEEFRITRAEQRRREKAKMESITRQEESVPIGGARPKVKALQEKLQDFRDK